METGLTIFDNGIAAERIAFQGATVPTLRSSNLAKRLRERIELDRSAGFDEGTVQIMSAGMSGSSIDRVRLTSSALSGDLVGGPLQTAIMRDRVEAARRNVDMYGGCAQGGQREQT
jgi:hypothetical protein